MGPLGRARRWFRKRFPSRKRASRREPEPGQFFGSKEPDERYEGEHELPAGWRVEVTFPDQHATPDYYSGGDLPSYMSRLASRVVVSFTHAGGGKSYRTIHGPVPDMERLAQLIANVAVVSPT